jgi:histidinol-phosphate aminotransferase
MFSLDQWVRPNIKALKPYTSARSEYAGREGIFLDANENPYGIYNRYPDPLQQQVKQAWAQLQSIATENLFIGNGSDEIIDLAFRIFCKPGTDKVLILKPSYGMYEVAAAINDIALVKVPLDNNFQVDTEHLSAVLAAEQPKLLFLCSPNNPTGNCLEGIETIVSAFNGIVLLDEAYIDFAERPSFVSRISMFPNLIVLQTLSKAWGLAAARIGIACASPEIVALLTKVKPPYNVSALNQEAALAALSDTEAFRKRKTAIIQQRLWLEQQLQKLPIVRKVYPSEANFLLVEMTDAGAVYEELVQRKIITRNRHNQISNCIRITAGRPEENKMLMDALEEIALSISQNTANEKSTLY